MLARIMIGIVLSLFVQAESSRAQEPAPATPEVRAAWTRARDAVAALARALPSDPAVRGDVADLIERLDRLGQTIATRSTELQAEQIEARFWIIEFTSETSAAWLGSKGRAVGAVEGAAFSISGEDIESLKTRPGTNVVSAPAILALAGQDVSLEVGDEREVSYLQHEGDGIYRIRQERIWDGVRLRFKTDPGVAADTGVRFSLDVEVIEIAGTTPVAAGADRIGQPLVSRRQHRCDAMVSSQPLAIPIGSAGGGKPMVVIVAARVLGH